MTTENRIYAVPAAQLSAARNRAGLSQSAAARLLKIPRQQLWRWERGLATPRYDSLMRALAAPERKAKAVL